MAIFAACYALAALLGRATVLPGEKVSLVWPAAGVAVLWLMRSPRMPSVLTIQGGILTTVLLATGASPTLALAGAVAAAAQAALIVTAIRRWLPGVLGTGGQESIHSLRVLGIGTGAVVTGCVAGSLIGSTALYLDAGTIAWQDGVLWFGRQLAGVMIIGSVGHLTWERLEHPRHSLRSAAPRVELAILWVTSGLVYGAVFLRTVPLAFLAIPLTVWCAVRFSTYAATIHAAVFGTAAVVLTLQGRGPFSLLTDPAVAALVTQGFILVALLTALAVGSVRDQREEAMARLVVAEATAASRAELLAAMTEAMAEGLVVVDASGEVVRVNDAARRLLARPPVQEVANATDLGLLRADGSALPMGEHPAQRALTEGDVAAHDVIIPLADGRRRVVSVRATALSEGIESVDGPTALLVYRDVTVERAESHRLAEFAELTAHDLRSPLTTVRGWVSLAQEELSGSDPSPERARELLGKAVAGATRLDELIEGLLDQALAEGADLHLERLDLAGPDGLVAEVGELLGLTSLVIRGPHGPVVLGDQRLVRQVLANLLGNAVKYAAPGRPLAVEVDLEVRGSRVRVQVSDNGRGIPAAQREAVFDRFNRADSGSGHVVGSGIGLSICRVAVERHGGTIRCDAGPDNTGTTFTFDLPFNNEHTASAQTGTAS